MTQRKTAANETKIGGMFAIKAGVAGIKEKKTDVFLAISRCLPLVVRRVATGRSVKRPDTTQKVREERKRREGENARGKMALVS